MIGIPGEIYTFGTIFAYGFLIYPPVILIAVKVFLPVFTKLRVTSIYEVRKCICTQLPASHWSLEMAMNNVLL